MDLVKRYGQERICSPYSIKLFDKLIVHSYIKEYPFVDVGAIVIVTEKYACLHKCDCACCYYNIKATTLDHAHVIRSCYTNLYTLDGRRIVSCEEWSRYESSKQI